MDKTMVGRAYCVGSRRTLTFISCVLASIAMSAAIVTPAYAYIVGHFYAIGQNDETYDKYGIYSSMYTTDPTIRGTTWEGGATVGIFIGVADPWTTDFVATGFYKGRSPPPDLIWTGSTKHYYWDKKTYGVYQFSDISQGTGKVPNNGDWISYCLQGSLDGKAYWYVTIERPGDYTINIKYISHNAGYEEKCAAQMESHNNGNIATSHFNYLRNLKKTGTSWTWVSWAASHPVRAPNDATNPYYATKISETRYQMYTSS